MRVRRALLKDLNAVNELTFEMHEHLGALVSIKFTLEDLNMKCTEAKKTSRTCTLPNWMERSWATCSSPTSPEENEFFGKHHHLYHIAVKQEKNDYLAYLRKMTND